MANTMNTTYNQQTTAPSTTVTQKSNIAAPTTVQKPATTAPSLTVQPAAPGATIQQQTAPKRAMLIALPSPVQNPNISAPTGTVSPGSTNIPGGTPSTPNAGNISTNISQFVANPNLSTNTQDVVPPYGTSASGLAQWKSESPADFDTFFNKINNIATPLSSFERPPEVPSAMWNDLVTAVENKVGKETWQLRALPKLKEWFPDTPEEELPAGALWTDDLPNIKKRLNDEYKLDTQLSNIQKMQSSGLNIEEDLQSYIRSRDKFVTNIDGMIDKVNNLYTNTDVSDPAVRGLLDKYRNYLYVSKGRQTMRYDQYVKSSVNEYKAQLKSLTDQYNESEKAFNDAYSTEKEITKERYSYYKGLLEDLYDNLDQREKATNDDVKAQLDALKLADEQIKTTVEAGGGVTLNDTQKSNSKANYIKMYGPSQGNQGALDAWNKLSDVDKFSWADSDAPKIAMQGWLDNELKNTTNEYKINYVRSRGFKPSDFGLEETLDFNSLLNMGEITQ
jgi:hypothetical protein